MERIIASALFFFFFTGTSGNTAILVAKPSQKTEMDTIRSKAEMYYKSMNTFSIKYQESWTPSNSQYVQTMINASIEERAKKLEKFGIAKDEKTKANEAERSVARPTMTHVDLVDQYPSIRYRAERLIGTKDEPQRTENVERILHKGIISSIRKEHRFATSTTNVDMKGFPVYTPVSALGKRIPYSINQSLSDLLSSASAKVIGTKDVGGEKLTTIQIGPDFGIEFQPTQLPARAYILVDLLGAEAWKPKRITYILSPDKQSPVAQNVIITFNDYQRIPTANGTETVEIPMNIECHDFGGWTILKIDKIILNNIYSSDDFASTIPAGYSHSIDGAANKVVLTGGTAEQQKSLQRINNRANELLGKPLVAVTPPRISSITWIVLSTCLGLAAFAYFLYRRRQHNA
jgi:actin-related protein